jgi:hypothetical protein
MAEYVIIDLTRLHLEYSKQMAHGQRIFLSAEWRDLVMLNYEVDRKLLSGYVPPGTVLDSFLRGEPMSAWWASGFVTPNSLVCFPCHFMLTLMK